MTPPNCYSRIWYDQGKRREFWKQLTHEEKLKASDDWKIEQAIGDEEELIAIENLTKMNERITEENKPKHCCCHTDLHSVPNVGVAKGENYGHRSYGFPNVKGWENMKSDDVKNWRQEVQLIKRENEV